MRQQLKVVGTACLWLLVGLLLAMGSPGEPRQAIAAEKTEAQSIVDKSKATLADLLNDNVFSWLHEHLRGAKGVVIFPQVIKGGFFVGGSGGTGVLLVRNEVTGSWSAPAFYTLGSVTFGLQIGGEAAEVIMVAMDQKAVDSLLSSSVKLGGDVSIAIGPIGGGAKGAVTIPEVTADFVSFTRAKGLYGGLNLEGALLAVRDGLNSAYYGRSVSPREILSGAEGIPSGAAELRELLERTMTRK